MTDFTSLGLAAPLLKALAREGYEAPTPIQSQAIPHVMQHKDVLGIAQTGTGKTAAFALPLLHHLATHRVPAPRRGCRVLVLSPTRELASQIAQSFRTYGAGLNLKIAVIFGGVGFGPQIKALEQGLDVLVATPGRLLDHMNERRADLRHTEVLVLDEVDQMLDLGFIHPIRQIVAVLPKQRQNLFFSATMPREIRKLADELLRDPVSVSVAPVATTVERVEQRVIFVEAARKRDLLAELFADPALARAIVFTRTKRGADKVAKHLQACGVPAEAIHGNKSQGQRERSLAMFRNGKARALVATDIAARGIDIDGVTHVVNYELPNVPEAYVHRIGRTARAGAAGAAIALCDREEMPLLRDIEKLTRLRLPATDRRDPAAMAARPAEPRENDRREHQPHRAHRQHQRHDANHAGERRADGQAPRGERSANGRPQGQPSGNGKPGKHKSWRRFGKPGHRGQRGPQRVAAE